MKLVRIGDVVFNMDQLLAVKDEGSQMLLFFAGSSNENVLSATLEGESCQLMRNWLNRCGVNNLATENPIFNWLQQPPTVDYNKTESHRVSR